MWLSNLWRSHNIESLENKLACIQLKDNVTTKKNCILEWFFNFDWYEWLEIYQSKIKNYLTDWQFRTSWATSGGDTHHQNDVDQFSLFPDEWAPALDGALPVRKRSKTWLKKCAPSSLSITRGPLLLIHIDSESSGKRKDRSISLWWWVSTRIVKLSIRDLIFGFDLTNFWLYKKICTFYFQLGNVSGSCAFAVLQVYVPSKHRNCKNRFLYFEEREKRFLKFSSIAFLHSINWILQGNTLLTTIDSRYSNWILLYFKRIKPTYFS